MADSAIPLVDLRSAVLRAPLASTSTGTRGDQTDRLGRVMRDLRISVTDRCNFRCSYCMPKEVFDSQYAFLPQSSLLTFEEITRVAGLFVSQGVQKLRLTGGEPLLRRHLEVLIGMLAQLKTPQGQALDLTLTTNASLLRRKAQALKDAGLQRITISLDALDDQVFRQMNDVDFPVHDVLDGIRAAVEVGLGPVKVNMVVKRGVNEQEILPMARFFREEFGGRVVLRFIEYMDVGTTNGWKMDHVVPSAEVRGLIHQAFPLEPLQAGSAGETAERWRYADGRGEVGFISSVTQAFCGACNRARLSTEGRLYLCLFANRGYDLRTLLRDGATDDQIADSIAQIWTQREDRYSALRGRGEPGSDTGARRVEMHYIGG